MPPPVLVVPTPVIAIVMTPPIMLAIVLPVLPVILSGALFVQVQFKQSRPIQIMMIAVMVTAIPIPKISITTHPARHAAIVSGIAMIDAVKVSRRINNDLSSASAAWG